MSSSSTETKKHRERCRHMGGLHMWATLPQDSHCTRKTLLFRSQSKKMQAHGGVPYIYICTYTYICIYICTYVHRYVYAKDPKALLWRGPLHRSFCSGSESHRQGGASTEQTVPDQDPPTMNLRGQGKDGRNLDECIHDLIQCEKFS